MQATQSHGEWRRGGEAGGGAMRLRGRAARSRKISRRTSRGVQKIDIVFAEGRAWACSWVEGPGDSRPAQKGRRPAGGTTRRRARRRAGLALGGSVSGSDLRTGSPEAVHRTARTGCPAPRSDDSDFRGSRVIRIRTRRSAVSATPSGAGPGAAGAPAAPPARASRRRR